MKNNLLTCVHHIHHSPDGGHIIHHCGGDHLGSMYTISHCKCGLHIIDQEYMLINAHAINEVPAVVQFHSKCPYNKKMWHIESGTRA